MLTVRNNFGSIMLQWCQLFSANHSSLKRYREIINLETNHLTWPSNIVPNDAHQAIFYIHPTGYHKLNRTNLRDLDKYLAVRILLMGISATKYFHLL